MNALCYAIWLECHYAHQCRDIGTMTRRGWVRFQPDLLPYWFNNRINARVFA